MLLKARKIDEVFDAKAAKDACQDVFRKLQDGVLPQADILNTRITSDYIRIRYRRIYLQELAPTFLCFITSHGESSQIHMSYKRGITLISWTWLAIVLSCLFMAVYLFVYSVVNLTVTLATMTFLVVLLCAIMIREGKLQDIIRIRMRESIIEVISLA